MAYTGKTTQYIDSVKYAAVTTWAATTAKAVGDVVRPTAPALNAERVYVCIVAGTTGSTQPTWGTSRGDKNTDGTVTWQEFTGDPAGCGDLTSVPDWVNGAKSTNVSQGHIIKDVAGTHIFIASTANNNAGTGAEPSWNVAAPGNTTTDNLVTWTYLGTGFTSWQCAHARMQNALATGWGNNASAATDPSKFWVADEHAETQSTGSINWATRGSLATPIDIMCVAVAGSRPPVSADLPAIGTTPASITTTGANGMALQGFIRVCYGIAFNIGTSSNVSWSVGENVIDKNFENCKFTFGSGTGSGATFQFPPSRMIFKDCTWKFANVGQGFAQLRGQIRFVNCSIDAAGSIPTQWLQETTSSADFSFEGCDLSALSGVTLGGNNSAGASNSFGFYDCKMAASFTPWSFTGTSAGTGEKITFSRCSSGANPLHFVYIERSGTLTYSTSIYRTGGASENGVAFGWGIITNAACSQGNLYFDIPPIAKNNQNTGVNVTVTIHGIANAAALPTNYDIAMEVQYLGNASFPQATIKSTRVADFIATPAALTADSTSAWDAGATARANSTAYVVGDVRKVSSNADRLFFCTTAGTSSGSLPGGYASAVDGGSVTDGSAVFRAGMRFTIALVLTSPQPQLAGMLFAKLKYGKPSTTYYLDPTLTLT